MLGSAGASPSASGRQHARRAEAHEVQARRRGVRFQGILRVLRQVAREDGRLLAPVEHLAARCARPASARRRCTEAPRRRLSLRPRSVARKAARACTPTSAPDALARPMARSVMRRRIASRRSWLEEWMWSALVAANRSLSMRRPMSALSHEALPMRNTRSDAVERVLQVGDGLAPLVHGTEHVDEHDLAIEPAEMVAKERPHDVRLIALEAPRHHGGERAARDRAPLFERQRAEGEQRRAFEIARHQEAAGTRRVQHMVLGPRRLEVVGKEARALECNLLVLARVGIDRAQEFEPRLGGAMRRAACARAQPHPPTRTRSSPPATAGRSAIRRGSRRRRG